ncbi:polysaccharide deacetylase family protein [Zoogloea sp.]|uniref:polysaccharide deacetylase family protein n=1 Tax=Zoogloea sp. TaxID=49181 RepID=UPI0035B14BE9
MITRDLPLMLGGLASLFGGRSSRFGTLIFHRVVPEPDPLQPGEICAAQFDELIGVLVRYFNILSAEEAIEAWQAGKLPPRTLVITFDDGYADNFTIAYPILRKHGVRALFFIASGYLDGGVMFNDAVIETVRRTELNELDLDWMGLGRYALSTVAQRRTLIQTLLQRIKYLSLDGRCEALDRLREEAAVALPADLMLTTGQLRGLSGGGMAIGGHTTHHPILAVLDEDQAMDEVVKNRLQLADLLGEAPRFFAYPNGKPGTDYTAQNVRMIERAGYEAAFTTSWGSVGRESGIYELPRFTPWERQPGRFCLRIAQNFLRVNAPQLATPALAS